MITAEIFMAKPTLYGESVTLRPFQERDITAMADILMDPEVCNFRILLGPGGRNRGLGSEATRLVVDYAFQSTNINRIELDVYAFNPRARHVYEEAGFLFEGTKRSALKFDGEYVDADGMAILRSDWLVLCHRPGHVRAERG